MNKQQLREILSKECIRDDVYDLDGGHPDEVYTLHEQNGCWLVYYSERGLKSEKKEFGTESEACEYLLNKLREDPTTRGDAPVMTPQKLFEILRKERIREANGRWFVFWTASPLEGKETEFATEADAVAYLRNKLMMYST